MLAMCRVFFDCFFKVSGYFKLLFPNVGFLVYSSFELLFITHSSSNHYDFVLKLNGE